jgi:hypothetical protein
MSWDGVGLYGTGHSTSKRQKTSGKVEGLSVSTKSTLWGKGSPLSNLYPQMPKNPHLPSNHPTRMLPDSSFFSFKIVFYSTTKNG